MVRKINVIILLLLAATGVYYYFFHQATDKELIGKSFTDLSYYVSKSSGEGAAKMAYKVNLLADLFAEPCNLDVPYSFLAGSYSQTQITANATRARAQFKEVSLKFYDQNIDVIDKNKAKVDFTVRLSGTLKSGKSIDETREMEATLKKKNNKWLFTNFKLVQVLEK